jgi:AAA+ ATPase superfamily predicted ATPase
VLLIFFNERPKETMENSFDRDEELSLLQYAVSEPIVLLTGIRRIGKTSILKVFLNNINLPYALIDARISLSSCRALYTIFSNVFSKVNRKNQ